MVAEGRLRRVVAKDAAAALTDALGWIHKGGRSLKRRGETFVPLSTSHSLVRATRKQGLLVDGVNGAVAGEEGRGEGVGSAVLCEDDLSARSLIRLTVSWIDMSSSSDSLDPANGTSPEA